MRDAVLHIRLSAVDKGRIEREAVQSGLKLSDYVRARLLEATEGPDVRTQVAEVAERVEDHEHRIRRVEALAEGSDY